MHCRIAVLSKVKMMQPIERWRLEKKAPNDRLHIVFQLKDKNINLTFAKSYNNQFFKYKKKEH